MYPRLADAIGLKHMFDGFGSRKKVEPDDKEVQNMRRRQSFIDSTADNDEEEDDDDDEDEDEDNDEGVPLGLSFDGPKKSMHSLLFGDQKKTLRSRVRCMIQKKKNSSFMAQVRAAIANKKELSANICTAVVDRVHVDPDLLELFPYVARRIDWLDKDHAAEDAMKQLVLALETEHKLRTEGQVAFIHTCIEDLNVWSTMCPDAPRRDMLQLCRQMGYERHDATDDDDGSGGRGDNTRDHRSSNKRRGEKKNVVYEQTDNGHAMYIVLEGGVLCHRSYHDKGRVRYKRLPQMRYGAW